VEELIKNNLGLQILTDTGWSDFDGVIDKGHRQVVKLQLTNCSIKTTLDHDVYTDRLQKKSVRQLKVGDKIYTKQGNQSVVSIILLGTESVYDLLNVKNNRRFFANDVLCSNCEFIINDETLIAPAKLIDLIGREPEFKTGEVRWYKKPEAGRIYCVGLDPSLGTGGDPAAIEVWEANSTEQVAEWRHNRTDIPTQIRIMTNIIQHIYDITGDDKSIYYTVENNSIGEAALLSIAEFGEENIRGYFLSESGRARKGFNTTNKPKLAACAKLKHMIESNRMQIHSRSLISELKTFVAHGTSYAAKAGETDDLVMATVLVVRMLQTLQDYHPELDRHMRDHATMIEPLPFVMTMM
jgi:intein/homing endonuclease